MAIGIETNILYQGDCKDILRNFPSESVDLIYLDPPFFSNRTYEIIWGNGAELKVFEDRWKGGIPHYIGWIVERLELMKVVLKNTGLIYLHCDWHASHYLKVAMDKIFGENNFRNEIIWCYGGGGLPKNDFGRKHDIIFRYSKSDNYTYHPVFKAYKETTLKVGRHSLLSGGKPLSPKGTPITDWWADLVDVTSYSKEWLNYPTQKPESLIERIIRTSSNEGDIVLDPMMGGGTTLAVAQKFKRKWVGIDVSPHGIKTTAERLRKLGIQNIAIISGEITEAKLRKFKPFEFQKWVCDKLFGRVSDRKSGDMGIDGYTFDGVPIQVKQSDGVGRNVVDNFETAMRRVNRKKGIIVAFSFAKGTYDEVARAKMEEGLEIELKTIEDLLKKPKS